MTPIKNLILDWSGTLVNDFPPVLAATNAIFEQYGKPPMTEAEFREKFFLPFQEFYKIYLPEASQEEIDALYHEKFRLLQEEIPLLPHARELLDYCAQRGMPIFLLSTIHTQHFEVQAARLGIGNYFTRAYTQAFDKRKTILELLAAHELNADETLFVGDMKHDIEAARHGGVQSCAMLTGYDSLEKLKTAQPDLVFQHLGHLRDYLARHQQPDPSPPLSTVGALIFNDRDEVLMLHTHKWSNLWGIPGGKIKRGETAEAGVRREVLEETGLTLRDVQFVMVHDCIDSTEFYRPAHFLLLNYTARATHEHVVLNDEADDWRWVSLTDALQMPLNHPTRLLIQEVMRLRSPLDTITLDGIRCRTHIGVPDEERAQPQELLISLHLQLRGVARAAASDEVEHTVDYAIVYEQVRALAAQAPRRLIERLAEEIAQLVLREHPLVERVRVEIEKFILPETRRVLLTITRGRASCAYQTRLGAD